MIKTRPISPASSTLRARILLVVAGMVAVAGASLSGIASCGNQSYWETQTAARTAYEAAESARRAANASTVASIDLRNSNDRVSTSVDRLTAAIASKDLSHHTDAAQGNTPASTTHDTVPSTGDTTKPVDHTIPAIDSNKPDISKPDSSTGGKGADACKGDDEHCKPRESCLFKNAGQDDNDSMFDLDIAFAATAFLALVAISHWTTSARAKACRDSERGDWMLVASAACAAMVSISLVGAAYFAVRVYRAGPSAQPLWNMPWQAMAWIWCGLVLIGLLLMWVSSFAGFWQRVGDIDHTRRPAPAKEQASSESADKWRLWISVLAVGLLPAFGLLIEGRFALLLGMLLVLVYALFAGGATLAACRENPGSRTAPAKA